jgi:hypothetical protein
MTMGRESMIGKVVQQGMRGCLVVLAIGMALDGSMARAQPISYVDMFRSDEYLQTADGNSLSTVGSFLGRHPGKLKEGVSCIEFQ